MASPVAEHRLRTRRLSGHGSRAQPLRGMWDLPGPGHEPASPASAGGPPTTAPPGKPPSAFFISYPLAFREVDVTLVFPFRRLATLRVNPVFAADLGGSAFWLSLRLGQTSVVREHPGVGLLGRMVSVCLDF